MSVAEQPAPGAPPHASPPSTLVTGRSKKSKAKAKVERERNAAESSGDEDDGADCKLKVDTLNALHRCYKYQQTECATVPLCSVDCFTH